MGRRRMQSKSNTRFIGAEIDLKTHRAFRGKLLDDDCTAAYVLPILIQWYINGEITISEYTPEKNMTANNQPVNAWAEDD